MTDNCPFCTLPDSRILLSNDWWVAIRDGYPISAGHTLIVPKRHLASFFDIADEERLSMLDMLSAVKTRLDAEYNPAAYNVGINDGPAAGQTVPHLHIHLIPRYPGDRDDPRGGVRWIIPNKARYWED